MKVSAESKIYCGVQPDDASCRAQLHQIISNLKEANASLDSILGPEPPKDETVAEEPPGLLGLIYDTILVIESMSANVALRLKEVTKRL